MHMGKNGQKMILSINEKKPLIKSSAYIAQSAVVVGDVVIGEKSSVWFNAVVRGDVNYIRIGKRSNIQDGCVLHVAREKYPLFIGDEVTIGHNATIHACNIGSRCLIGMGAVVMDGSKIGENCIIAAGALVTPKTIIPSGNLAENK